MPAKLDLSILETVKDPQLRAQLERLGQRMAASPRRVQTVPLPLQLPRSSNSRCSRTNPGLSRTTWPGARCLAVCRALTAAC